MLGYSIGIVDDEDEIRELLIGFLRGEGFKVQGVSTASALLELAGREHFNAFLVDVEIAGESGLDLCRKLRSMEIHKHTPILCVTGLDETDILQEAFNAGADDFIGKPISLLALRSRLKVQLQKNDYFAKLERAREMLKRYLSPRVATIADEYSETGHVPPPEERQVAICFTDIRGFTARSESMDPVKLFSLLSAHLRDQIELVYRWGGYVDKFNGDGLMAVFDGTSMVEKCCLCALNIMELTSDTSGSWDKFPIGIGIHTGPVVVGNIGSPEHLDYSAVGTSVNLAARLCGYAQPQSIIVSDAVRRTIGENPRLAFLEERHVDVRGVSGAVIIYRLVSK